MHAREPQKRALVGWVRTCLIARFFCTVAVAGFSQNAQAELDDFYFTQRVGVAQSRGSLAAQTQRLALETSLSRSYQSYPWGIAFDFGHELNFYIDEFKTRSDETLYFPLQPDAQARVFEPSLGQNLCLFSMSNYHVCLSVGLSFMHIQNDSENYQRYVGIPAGIRMTYVPDLSPVVWEVGVRYRGIQNRTSGFTNVHEDLFTFVSLGLASINSR